MFQACFSTPGSSGASRGHAHAIPAYFPHRQPPISFSRCTPVSVGPGAGRHDPSQPDPSDSDDPAWERRVASEVDGYYRTDARRLINQLTRRAGSRDDAREILHEAVARFLGRGARHAPVKRIDSYVAETSHNLLTDRGRSRSRFSTVEEKLRSCSPAHHDPVVFLESRDTLRRLEQAMLKLKPRTREIFMAHRLDGLSYAEIAQETGLSVKGVEKHMSKAIAKLSRFLDRP